MTRVRLGSRWGLVCLGLLCVTRETRAQLEEGEPIANSDFSVDASQGPITGSTRVIGLGGAFVAIAQGAEGTSRNPAAVAVRLPHSWHAWDYNRSIDFGIASWLPQTDFLNSSEAEGETTQVKQDSLLFASIAANLYYLRAGIGFAAEGRRQALQRQDSMAGLSPTKLRGNFGVFHASLGYGFGQGQVVVGAGPRITGLSLRGTSGDSDLVSAVGVGTQAGAVVKLNHAQWRVGLVAKSSVNPGTTSDEQPVAVDDDTELWRPEKVTLPWEVAFGFAYQFGPRSLNLPFVSAVDGVKDDDPKSAVALRKRYLELSRSYLLVSTELLVVGTTSDSVSLASAIEGTVRRSGEELAWSPRLGVESEVIPHYLTLRAGSYLESGRMRVSDARWHATLGFDVKLFAWDMFGILTDFDEWTFSAAADVAEHYLNTSFSIGIWH